MWTILWGKRNSISPSDKQTLERRKILPSFGKTPQLVVGKIHRLQVEILRSLEEPIPLWDGFNFVVRRRKESQLIKLFRNSSELIIINISVEQGKSEYTHCDKLITETNKEALPNKLPNSDGILVNWLLDKSTKESEYLKYTSGYSVGRSVSRLLSKRIVSVLNTDGERLLMLFSPRSTKDSLSWAWIFTFLKLLFRAYLVNDTHREAVEDTPKDKTKN